MLKSDLEDAFAAFEEAQASEKAAADRLNKLLDEAIDKIRADVAVIGRDKILCLIYGPGVYRRIPGRVRVTDSVLFGLPCLSTPDHRGVGFLLKG